MLVDPPDRPLLHLGQPHRRRCPDFHDVTAQKQAREKLEKELEKRTAELATISEQLHQEIVEHQRVILGHQQAEKSLRDREARLRAIIDTAVDAIITIDERGLIQSTNPATEKMFGYTSTELIGRNVSTLMPSPYREEHDGYLMRYLQTGEKRIIGIGREVSGRRKDGTVFPVELAVSEMHADGGRFTGILHDTTRRKKLEREILEIAGLEQNRIGQDLHDNVGTGTDGTRFADRCFTRVYPRAFASGSGCDP